MKTGRPILLVEDDRIDIMTIERCISDLNISNPLDVAKNGLEALNHLKSGENTKPSIILLDINMPKMNGHEFLATIKADPGLKRIPVIIMTTSEDAQDKTESFNLGAAGYMIKPVDYKKFVEVVRAIDLYWTLSELSEDDEV